MKRLNLALGVILALCLISTNSWGAWPSDSIRTKNWGSEVLTDSDLEAQFDLLHTYANDAFDETTGHKHDGTANEGVLIDLNDDAGVIGVKNQVDAANGGTGLTTITDGGVMLGSGTGDVTPMAVLADGSIIMGDGTTDPIAVSTFTGTTGFLKHEFGGVEFDVSAITKGDIITSSGTGVAVIQTVGANDTFAIADSSQSNGWKWGNPGFAMSVEQSTTFSTASTVTITETISSGDVYEIVIEGTASSADYEPTIRINGDSTGTNYRASMRGTAGGTSFDEADSSDVDGIDILGTTARNLNVSGFLITLRIIARNSDTMVMFEAATYDGANSVTDSRGSAFYDQATPTSITMERRAGAATVTGRFYVFKLKTQ